MFSKSFIQNVFKDSPKGLYIPDSGFKRIWSDSRTLKAGDLFIAIKGENFDGHNFVAEAQKHGALGALVSKSSSFDRSKISKDFSLIEVDDTIEGVRRLAASYRKNLSCSVFAVAGSNGKTTTKEWLAFLLQKLEGKDKIYKTEKSLNSILGIALSLLQIRNESIAVIEVGIDEPGWMEQHLSVVAPDFGLITTIGEEHLNRLKSIEIVAEEELKLLDYIRKNKGSFAANLDSDWIAGQIFPENHLTYSLEKKAHIEGKFIVPNILHAFGIEWKNPLPGKHNAQNLLAALTGVLLLKKDFEKKDLQKLSLSTQEFAGEAHRSQWRSYKDEIQIYDDCYNANSDSMQRALQAYAEVADGCIQRVVLGDMLDLGESSEAAHQRVLNLAIVLGFSEIYLFGPQFKKAKEKAISPPKNIHTYESIDELSQALEKRLKPGDTVFLKGSRGMKLERILDYLKNKSII